MSVLDGTTDAGNITVLTRKNTTQNLSATQAIPATASNTAGQSLTSTVTASVSLVRLEYFAGPGQEKVPSSPASAYLVISASFSSPEVPQGGGLPGTVFTVTTPAGLTATGVDLSDDPASYIIGVEVPGDFTVGTLTIGGAASDQGVTITFGGSFAIPLDIPAG